MTASRVRGTECIIFGASPGNRCADILRHVISMHVSGATHQAIEPWCDYLNPRAELHEVRIGNGEVSALMPVYGNMNWSQNFGHGADMVFPIAELAGLMLSKEGIAGKPETLESLERVTFMKRATGSLRVRMLDGREPDMNKSTALKGSFRTSTGRLLYFKGDTEPGTACRTPRAGNDVSQDIALRSNITSTDESTFMVRADVGPETISMIGASPAFKASTLADVFTSWITLAFTDMQIKSGKDVYTNIPYCFVLRIEDMPLVDSVEMWNIFCEPKGIPMVVKSLKRPLVSGMEAIRFEFHLPRQKRPVVVHAAHTYEESVLDKADRRESGKKG